MQWHVMLVATDLNNHVEGTTGAQASVATAGQQHTKRFAKTVHNKGGCSASG